MADDQFLIHIAKASVKAGLQLCAHTIGDRALQRVLDSYQKALKSPTEGQKARFRIEHLQMASPKQLRQMSRLGCIAAIMPIHYRYDRNLLPKILDDMRIAQCYPWHSLSQAGISMALGTDWPIAPANPFENMAELCGVGESQNPNHTAEVISLEEALTAYLRGSARACFTEGQVGHLMPGAFGDFICLDTNIFTTSLKKLAKTQTLKTYISGRLVFSRV